MDLPTVERAYESMQRALPDVTIQYAVKANPSHEVIARLAVLGARFDVASWEEAKAVMGVLHTGGMHGVSHGAVSRRAGEAKMAYFYGVRTFTADCVEEIENLSRDVPGASVMIRMKADAPLAVWPLSGKFGAEPALVPALIRHAQDRLRVVGISMHLGSQQQAIGWGAAVVKAREIVDSVTWALTPEINLGGGFPCHYLTPPDAPFVSMEAHLTCLAEVLRAQESGVRFVVEPGRALVADAGTIFSRVLLSRELNPRLRAVYLDVGIYGGLFESTTPHIRYPIESAKPGPVMKTIVYGPTCDDRDVLPGSYLLPATLAQGDLVRIYKTGAYTSTTGCVGYAGHLPVRTEQ